jgi:hypothetical protein
MQSNVDPTEASELNEGEEQPKQNTWTTENFYALDGDSNILMDGEVIKAATLPKLIAKMTSDGASNSALSFVHLLDRSHFFERVPVDLSVIQNGWLGLVRRSESKECHSKRE